MSYVRFISSTSPVLRTIGLSGDDMTSVLPIAPTSINYVGKRRNFTVSPAPAMRLRLNDSLPLLRIRNLDPQCRADYCRSR